ncbi:MAG: TRAP transporter large permease [Spirochaetota bacterium]
MPHSILHTNVIANMLFGAISGSATAAAVGVGSIIEPHTKKEGYEQSFATCVNIASAPAGLLIPPSNTLILYSVVSGQASVIALFLGGYLPGILMGLSIILLVALTGKKFINRRVVDNSKKKNEWMEWVKIVLDAFPSLMLIVIIIFGILGGIFTATEAAGIAVLYALLLSFFYRNVSLKGYFQILKDSAIVSGVILFIIAASNMMGWVLAYTQAPEIIANYMLSLSDNKYIILLLINLILLFVGTFLDMSPAVLIFTPIFLPIANQIGIHPVHFGIILTYNLCIGILTPPVGTLLFIGSSISGISVKLILKKIIPFYVVLFISLLFITFFPELSLALPKLAGLI